MKKIGNEKLQLYLQTRFGKKIEDITEEECKKLEILPVEETNLGGEREAVDLSEVLPYFPNLKTINFERATLTQEDIELLSGIKQIKFSKCDTNAVEDYSCLRDLEKVEWVQCFYKNHDWLTTLNRNIRSLSIRDPFLPSELDIHSISDINLKELLIEGYSIKNARELEKFQNCEFLSLYNVPNASEAIPAIEQMPALKEIIIEEEIDPERMQNKDIIVNSGYRGYLFDEPQMSK